MVIAVNLRIAATYNQQLIIGIMQYVARQKRIKLWFTDQDFVHTPRLDTVDGIIGSLWPGGLIKEPASAPIVNVTGRQIENIHHVHCDNKQVVRLALQHFQDCNIHYLAYLHIDGNEGSDTRRSHFVSRCNETGLQPHVLHCGPNPADIGTCGRLSEALLAIPKPAGLLLPVDNHGPALLQLCRDLGIAVPDDIAVLGIDNNSDFCISCTPTLSSIDINVPQIGFLAARTIVDLIEGKDVPEIQLVSPKELVRRDSTVPHKTLSPSVAKVVDYLHAGLGAPLVMEDLVRQQTLGRRALEKAFHVEVGESPMRHLRILRLERVKYLLRTTELNVSEISRQCGFPHTTYLCRVFKQAFGTTPHQFRKGEIRAGGERSS